jgi:hypothetical protein
MSHKRNLPMITGGSVDTEEGIGAVDSLQDIVLI